MVFLILTYQSINNTVPRKAILNIKVGDHKAFIAPVQDSKDGLVQLDRNSLLELMLQADHLGLFRFGRKISTLVDVTGRSSPSW